MPATTANMDMTAKAVAKLFEKFLGEQGIDDVEILMESFNSEENNYQSDLKNILGNLKNTRTKSKKDPNKPKKPAGVYLRFCADIRPSVRKEMEKNLLEGEKVKMTDITKNISLKWNSFKEKIVKNKEGKEAKKMKVWESEIEKEMKDYNKAMKSYVPAPGTEFKRSSNKTPKTDPAKPKRPVSAYALFCTAHRDEVKKANPSAKATEITKALATAWKTLGASDDEDDIAEMESYTKIVGKEKRAFDKLMKSYKPSEGYDDKGRLITEESKKKAAEKAAKADEKKVVKPAKAAKVVKPTEESDGEESDGEESESDGEESDGEDTDEE